jgi:transcriptional regulator with XRE-family HTH domain
MSAGTLLRETRRRHGLSQKQLANRARTSQAAISRIGRGIVSPSVAPLERLLDLLGERLTADFNADDRLIGIEVLGASKLLPTGMLDRADHLG